MSVRRSLNVGVVVATTLALAGGVPGAAMAEPGSPGACAPKDPACSSSSVTVSSRPTTLYSAYVDGPATITYNKMTTTSVSASLSGSVSAEAGIIFAKASATIGVSVTGGRSWTDGFSYSLSVPKGVTRRMRLVQESRRFLVTKRVFDEASCSYLTKYSNSAVNAPRTTRVDRWILES